MFYESEIRALESSLRELALARRRIYENRKDWNPFVVAGLAIELNQQTELACALLDLKYLARTWHRRSRHLAALRALASGSAGSQSAALVREWFPWLDH